jgi:hypothetical protein
MGKKTFASMEMCKRWEMFPGFHPKLPCYAMVGGYGEREIFHFAVVFIGFVSTHALESEMFLIVFLD